jgi:uncharacterized glyoxalase superfamily protein PhnB
LAGARPAPRRFYQEVFELPIVFEDPVSAVFRFGSTQVNLLQATESDDLIAPARRGDPAAASTFLMTIPVDDVDARCADLAERGVELLNGPMDRPWGVRTASFRDPAGFVWEIAAPIAR